LAKATKAYYDYKKGKASKEWTKIFQHIERNGWDKSLHNQEAFNVLKNKAGRAWSFVIDKSMWMFGITEQLNRAVTIAGAYMPLRNKGKTVKEAIAEAYEISNEAHGVYGDVNMPAMGRGSNVASQIFKSFYVFRTFSHNYLQNLAEMVGDHNIKAALYMMLSPAILAGASASVITPVVAMMLKAFGIDEPEEEFYRWVENEFGPDAEGFARFGMMYPTDINIRGSLEIGIFDVPTNFKELFGAPGSMLADAYYGGRSIVKGNAYKGVEQMLPSFAAAPMKGYREYTKGVTTRKDAPVFYGREQMRPTRTDAVLRMLSFNPAELSRKREIQWKEKKVVFKLKERRDAVYAKIRRYRMLPVEERTEGRWADIIVDIEDYNNRAGRAMVYVPRITYKSIQTMIKRSFKPSKRERMRQGAKR
jgi:hypothetical protein